MFVSDFKKLNKKSFLYKFMNTDFTKKRKNLEFIYLVVSPAQSKIPPKRLKQSLIPCCINN